MSPSAPAPGPTGPRCGRRRDGLFLRERRPGVVQFGERTRRVARAYQLEVHAPDHDAHGDAAPDVLRLARGQGERELPLDLGRGRSRAAARILVDEEEAAAFGLADDAAVEGDIRGHCSAEHRVGTVEIHPALPGRNRRDRRCDFLVERPFGRTAYEYPKRDYSEKSLQNGHAFLPIFGLWATAPADPPVRTRVPPAERTRSAC